MNSILHEELLKICNDLFNKEIRRAKLNWQEFETMKRERELYHAAIELFKIDFMKSLKEVLIKKEQK